MAAAAQMIFDNLRVRAEKLGRWLGPRLWQMFELGAYSLPTGEWLLKWLPNGGSVILARSLLSAVCLCAAALIGWNLIDPGRSWSFSWSVFREQIIALSPWMAGALLTPALSLNRL
jgi:hypothetical protein